jgi:hypothetical protein
MGRKRETEPPVPVEVIRECFAVGDDGAIIRRSTGEVATFSGPGARLLVRVYHQGSTRRFAAGRVAWAIAVGEWPNGVVRCRNGVDDDLRESNLILAKAGPRPFDQARGGKRSSLPERQASDAALIRTLADHPGLTVPMISRLVGSSGPCTCVRLSRLADAGFCIGPKCDARARWELSQKGRQLAQASNPVFLDDLDRTILSALALTPLRQLALSRRLETCSLTTKRRTGLLISHGLVRQGAAKRFEITDQGRAALGPDAPRPWVRHEAVAASLAKDVTARPSLDVMTRVEIGKMGGIAAARLRKASLMDERMAS